MRAHTRQSVPEVLRPTLDMIRRNVLLETRLIGDLLDADPHRQGRMCARAPPVIDAPRRPPTCSRCAMSSAAGRVRRRRGRARRDRARCRPIRCGLRRCPGALRTTPSTQHTAAPLVEAPAPTTRRPELRDGLRSRQRPAARPGAAAAHLHVLPAGRRLPTARRGPPGRRTSSGQQVPMSSRTAAASRREPWAQAVATFTGHDVEDGRGSGCCPAPAGSRRRRPRPPPFTILQASRTTGTAPPRRRRIRRAARRPGEDRGDRARGAGPVRPRRRAGQRASPSRRHRLRRRARRQQHGPVSAMALSGQRPEVRSRCSRRKRSFARHIVIRRSPLRVQDTAISGRGASRKRIAPDTAV